ncbi:MAG: FAD-dependent oxidoreductase, partial [Propionicimonas sp.]
MFERTEHREVTISADGRDVRVEAGLTILTALQEGGYSVPSLCHDLRLERANGSCGLCVVEVGTQPREVKACITPVSEGLAVHTRSATLDAYRKIRVEQLLCDHNADCEPPCQQRCPAQIDIQRYLALVTDGNFEAAVRVMKDRNPFPSVCGRVCPHPCEAQCRRSLIDQPVAINDVKRFAADWDLGRDQPWIPTVGEPTGKAIAVVGAGPAGLSAAFFAALAGHQVTVFERQPKPGGMLRYGIPEYRLPKATLDAEIGIIEAMGVRIACGKSLGTHLRLEDLQQDFDAVYLA